MQHGVSTSSLELSGDTKSFDWVTRKWNVDYAFYKTSLDKYLLLFKAGQANGLTIDWAQALGEEFCADHFHRHQAIDNPVSERSIRPFCVGRAPLAIDSIKGAQASAIVYSIVKTMKANNLKPYEYLQHLVCVMMEHSYVVDTAHLDDLIPWSENLSDICKKAP